MLCGIKMLSIYFIMLIISLAVSAFVDASRNFIFSMRTGVYDQRVQGAFTNKYMVVKAMLS